MSGRRSRTPGTPTKVRTRREQIAYEEIPTKDITKSKSVGGTPKTRRFITNSAPNTANRKSCPEFRNAKQEEKHFRRHSENRAFVVQPIPYGNEEEHRRRSLSQSNLVQPNVTNNSILSSDTCTKSSTSTSNSLSRNIYKLWKNGRLCDMIIHAGGTQFHVHRLVMAASCVQFATSQQTIYQYDVPNVSAEVMDEVLDFFYTFKLNLTSANIEDVLEISQNLGVQKLLDMCINFLMRINLNNAVRNRAIAQRYGLNSVISAIDKYVHDHFSTLITTSSFLESEFSYIYDIISSDILTKPNELQIFHACAQWIDYKRNERIKYAIPLISLIRFALIAPSDIVAQVEPVTFIFEIPECKDMLYNAFRHHALFEESRTSCRVSMAAAKRGTIRDNNVCANSVMHTSKPQTQTKPASDTTAESSCTTTSMEYELDNHQPAERLENLPQNCGLDDSTKLYSGIIPESKRSLTPVTAPKNLEHPPSPQTKRDDSSINHTVNNGSQAIDGLEEAGKILNVKSLTEKFSKVALRNKKITRNDLAHIIDFFEPACKLSEKRGTNSQKKVTCHIPVNAFTYIPENVGTLPEHQKKSHAPGNFTEISSINSESEYELPPPPIPHVIMIVGGASAYGNDSYDDDDSLNNCIQQYDPALNTWRVRSRIPIPVLYSGVVLKDSYLYMIGGQVNEGQSSVPVKDCYRYNVANDKWDVIAPLKTARYRHATIVLNGTIYVIGGEDCIGMSCNTVEVYNHMSNTWSFIEGLHEARVGPAADAHRGRLYVAGGMMDVDEKLTLNTMEVYNPRTRSWTFRYPLPTAVCGSSMVEIAGTLYLVGGFVVQDGEPLSLDSIFRYDDETDTWSGYKTLHVPRHDAVTVALDSKLYIIGGQSSAAMGHALSNVECIDVETDKHVTGTAPLLTPAFGISGCVLSN